MNRRFKTIGIVGAVVLVATIAICCLVIKDWSGLTSTAFAFLLWSEIAFFVATALVEYVAAKSEQIITRSTWYFTVSVYSGIVFLLSLLNLGNHSSDSKWFWVVNIGLFALAVIAIVIATSASRGVAKSNQKTMEKLDGFNSIVSRMALLGEKLDGTDYSKVFSNLAEELRFTDATAKVPADEKIASAVSAAEIEMQKKDPDMEVIAAQASIINSAIHDRKIQLSSAKRGRI